MIWQGGFFFYAAIVVPIGTDVIGGFDQGRVTRHVTEWMNLIGIGTLCMMLMDHIVSRRQQRLNILRWICWFVMVIGLVASMLIHPLLVRQVEAMLDDYPHFYWWHETYLIIATVIWGMCLVWTALTLLPAKVPANG